MELTFARCKQVLETLPIGYYTGRRIETVLERDVETSFYSPTEDKIVVSYPIIAERAASMSDKFSDEAAVRTMLYHEVSHAILTPKALEVSNIINIFEDERIETVLRNYYHDVDFRQQLYDLCGGHAPKPQNAEQAFFNAVRFGLGTGAVQKEVLRLLRKYSHMNRATSYYDGSAGIYDYRYDIRHLYRMIEDEFEKEPEAFEEQKGSGKPQKGNGSKKPTRGQGQDEDTNKNTGVMGENDEPIEMNSEDIKHMVGACLGKAPDLSSAEITKLNEFQKTIETIIRNFNKKNSGGNGINAHSGVFNARAVTRQDYRYFERSMSIQGNNRFGTCHLNLFIDCSGSYESNVGLTNGILAVLSEIERKNKNFSMDVVFMNHEIKRCKNARERIMQAWGGNSVPTNMKEMIMGMQKPQTCNYNIVLFDGDAMCNNHELHDMDAYCKRFGAFDMKQTTLITDPDNQGYTHNFTSTKVVVTTRYTAELIKNITRALTIAFG